MKSLVLLRLLPLGNDPPRGLAYEAVEKFAKNEEAFLHAFAEAWWVGTTNGFRRQLSFLAAPAVTPSSGFACVSATTEAECAANGCQWTEGAVHLAFKSGRYFEYGYTHFDGTTVRKYNGGTE